MTRKRIRKTPRKINRNVYQVTLPRFGREQQGYGQQTNVEQTSQDQSNHYCDRKEEISPKQCKSRKNEERETKWSETKHGEVHQKLNDTLPPKKRIGFRTTLHTKQETLSTNDKITTFRHFGRSISPVGFEDSKRKRVQSNSSSDDHVETSTIQNCEGDTPAEIAESVCTSVDLQLSSEDSTLSPETPPHDTCETHENEIPNTTAPSDRLAEKCETELPRDATAFTEKSLPINFDFEITQSEWEGIYTPGRDREDKLVGNWTSLFSSKIEKFIPGCVWVFKSNRIKKTNSRKLNAPFYRGKAICNRDNCTTALCLSIKTEPVLLKTVIISVTVTGTQSHIRKMAKRQLKGLDRPIASAKASRMGIMNYYYQRLGEMSTDQIAEGNITHCQTPVVLRKAVSEWVQRDLLHKDLVQEVLLLKEAYIDNDSHQDKGPYSGYIQHVSADPFTAILFSKDQIRIVGSHQNGDFFLDATGSIIRNIPGQKRPLLYSLVLQISGAPPVSVADMITTSHTIPDITHFLLVVKRASSKLGFNFQPRKLETDWSWAEIQSGLLAFNSQNLKRYLNTCWQICFQLCEPITQFTVLHICSAHMTKAFYSTIKVVAGKNQEFTEFLMKGFVLLCNTTDMDSARGHFEDLCAVLLSKQVVDEVWKTKQRISKTDYNIGEEEVVARGEVTDVDSKTICESSPWYDYFQVVRKKAEKTVLQNTVDERQSNNLYCPHALDIMLKKYMSIFPLWSGMLLGPLSRYTTEKLSMGDVDETRSSNAPVEGWFKTVKVDILQRRTKLRPGVLISKLKKSVNGRVKELQSTDILRPKGRRRKSSIDTSTEKWCKGKRRKGNKYHPPRRETGNAGESTVKSTDRIPSVPKWGGTFQGKTLRNTCTLDNFLAILRLTDSDTNLRTVCLEDNSQVFATIVRCIDLMRQGKFSAAKFEWAERRGVPTGRTIDLYGNETDIFAGDIAREVTSLLSSTCSNKQCPEPYRRRYLKGISLHAHDHETMSTVSEMVENWRHPPPIPCNAECESGEAEHALLDEDGVLKQGKRCSGIRQQNRALENIPPMLCFNISDLVALGKTSSDLHEFSEEVELGERVFRLAGTTLHKDDHFTCAIRSTKHGWVFYDGLKGRASKLLSDDLVNCTPSQLIYIAT